MSTLLRKRHRGPSFISRLNRIQATSTRGVRARIRRLAGCATPTSSAGHAGATANPKLTFHLDHSAGADHLLPLQAPRIERPFSMRFRVWIASNFPRVLLMKETHVL